MAATESTYRPFVRGGPCLQGMYTSETKPVQYVRGRILRSRNYDEDDVEEFENKVCPTCGSCSGMYTANSMNCLTEVLGMGLRGIGTIPAVYSERIKLAKHAGMQVMEMYRKNIRPRDIMTKK